MNSLWPATLIDTAAIRAMPGGMKMIQAARTTDIVADAAVCILASEPQGVSGNFFTDVQVLESCGISDLEKYAVNPQAELIEDIFL